MPQTEDPGGGGESLLVVDDDPFIARLLEIELKAAGYDVRVASDGEQALTAAQERPPQLVLADVMMPNMDGFELTRRLRQDPRTATVSVIMLTARGLSADKLEGFAIGADDYIVKPFDTPELLARIRGVLNRASDTRSLSPMTGLAGNIAIEDEIEGRVAAGDPFAVLYVDLDRFKSYNDRYGFLRGDEAIRETARVIGEAAAQIVGAETFVGHAGGDDFVVVVPPEQATATAQQIVADVRRDGAGALRRGRPHQRLRRGHEPAWRSPAVPVADAFDRDRLDGEAGVPSLRGGRHRRHGDEAVHEGHGRLLVVDRSPHELIR